MDINFYASFSMFIKVTIIFAIFYFIVVFGSPSNRAKVKCPPGTETFMDNDSSERPCYKIVHSKMNYIEASRACQASNGFIPGVNNNLKDISITSSATEVLKQLYNEYYFWLGCHNLTGNLTCDDGTVLGNYSNWDTNNNISLGPCVVVSLKTGKWKSADCLQKYAFPCKYHSASTAETSTTPDPDETEPPPYPHPNHTYNLNITVDLTNLHLQLPNYTGLICWIFGILIIIFGCMQCLCFQCLRCLENMQIINSRKSRRRYDYRIPSTEGRNQRFGTFWSNPSSSSSSGLYSPDPSEEAARLLESQEEIIRQRAFSTFSNRNWIPTQIQQQQHSNNSPPRSVIITIPPPPTQSPQSTNIEELLALHGNYSNYPSFPRSEISSILEQLQNSGLYIRREDRAWDGPPQYPLYYRSADEEIGVALSSSVPQLLPPPPPYSNEISSFNTVEASLPLPTLPLAETADLPLTRTTVPPIVRIPPQINEHDNLANVRAFGIPVLPPAIENGTFENRIRRAQNRQNLINENESYQMEQRRWSITDETTVSHIYNKNCLLI